MRWPRGLVVDRRTILIYSGSPGAIGKGPVIGPIAGGIGGVGPIVGGVGPIIGGAGPGPVDFGAPGFLETAPAIEKRGYKVSQDRV
jgi:hypothetical protein